MFCLEQPQKFRVPSSLCVQFCVLSDVAAASEVELAITVRILLDVYSKFMGGAIPFSFVGNARKSQMSWLALKS